MYFSWAFIFLLVVYSLILLVFPGAEYLFFILLPLFALWALDLWLTVREPRFAVCRIFINPLYQHQNSKVEIRITNPLRRRVRMTYKDEPPFVLESGGYQGAVDLEPGGAVHISYEIVCHKRGVFGFGDFNMKYLGPLGLFSRQTKIPLKEEIKVYPDLVSLGDYQLACVIDSRREGLRRRKMLGAGGELSQLREYTPGDDMRMINWKVTAHTGKPIINEFGPEKDRNVFLLIDAGRMLFDQKDELNSRFDYILDSAMLLAYNAVDYGDMVGALTFHHKVDKFVPLGKGKRHLQTLVSILFDIQAVMVESDYRAAFRFWRQKANKRSLIFIYTDISDKESSREMIRHLQVVSRHHMVVCVLLQRQYLYDIIERPIKDEKDAFVKGTALELLAERETLKRSLLNSGIKVLEVTASQLKQAVLEHYLYLKHNGLF
ncbi:MAG: DUF58 domain-containing protein [Bacillota bacterium]